MHHDVCASWVLKDGPCVHVCVCVCIRQPSHFLLPMPTLQCNSVRWTISPSTTGSCRGLSYSGNTNTLTSSGNYPGNWLMCPITFLLLSSIVPLWYVGGDDGYGEEMMGMGRRWWVWGGDDGYGEEMMGMGRR